MACPVTLYLSPVTSSCWITPVRSTRFSRNSSIRRPKRAGRERCCYRPGVPSYPQLCDLTQIRPSLTEYLQVLLQNTFKSFLQETGPNQVKMTGSWTFEIFWVK